MKRIAILGTLLFCFTALVPASAQNFPRRSVTINLGDLSQILGGRSNSQDVRQAVAIANILIQMSSRRSPRQVPRQYPRPQAPRYPQPQTRYPREVPRTQPRPPVQPAPSTAQRPAGYAFIDNGGRPIRLDPRVLPLTINPGRREYQQVVSHAVSEWNSVGLGQLFALTDGPADLTIDWSGSKVSPGARAETRMMRSRNQVVPVDLSVRPAGRSRQQLARVMTHELGHVLGLDHSNDRRDIMYRSEQNAALGLTARDKQMARWVYSRRDYTPIIGQTDRGRMPSTAFAARSSGVVERVCRGHSH